MPRGNDQNAALVTITNLQELVTKLVTVTIVNEHGDEEVAQVLCRAILPFPVLLTAALHGY